MPDLSHTIAYSIVFGAVHNVLDGHPQWEVPQDFARSVAKRAAGTLMAHVPPSMLASARRSGQRRVFPRTSAIGGSAADLRRLLSLAHRRITGMVAVAYKDGDHGRYIELVTAARILKRELERCDSKEPTP